MSKCVICKKEMQGDHMWLVQNQIHGKITYCDPCFATLISNPPRGIFAFIFRLVHGGLWNRSDRNLHINEKDEWVKSNG